MRKGRERGDEPSEHGREESFGYEEGGFDVLFQRKETKEGGKVSSSSTPSANDGGTERTNDFQDAQKLLVLRLRKVNRHLMRDSRVVDC